MPLNLPAVLVIEKNKIASANPWLVTLDIVLSVSGTQLYLVHNTEDVVFQGRTYTAFPFQIEIPKIAAKGEIPNWKLRISNITMALQAYLEDEQGCVGSSVVMRFINAGYLSENFVDLETRLEVMASESDAEWITFMLGMPNPMNKRFPQYRYISDHCAWKFKSAECAYTGSAVDCKRSLAACRQLSNQKRFGGKIGMDNYNVRLA